jgi:4-amino-4-deoxy-L-arabinose transferase-like glycosyltransferase
MTETYLTMPRGDTQSTIRVRPRRWINRLRFWQSPADQPRWARPALLCIAAVAAVLYAWNIQRSGFAYYYAVAVKSMSVSWEAFFFGALDPGATITLDKLAGSFLPQALSARLFGYHPWLLTLPQVIEGVMSVLVMYRLVRRWFGAAAGLLAAALFALTPIAAAMFGRPMEDGALTLCLVLAADAFVRALAEARLRSLIVSGVWVGIGFQTKMLQAWMVLPAMALAYLFAAPINWRRRFAHLSLAGVVMLTVSLSWVLFFAVTPASARPYLDGTANNNPFTMVFAYNGLNRLGFNVPGVVSSIFNSPGGRIPRGTPGGDVANGFFGTVGPGKLLGQPLASQVGYLYPLALISLVIGLVWYRRGARWIPAKVANTVTGDPRQTRLAWGGFMFWGVWLVTYGLVFSRIRLWHTAYLSSLAPPVAALSAAGIVMLWRGYRDRGGLWLPLLPATMAIELAWTFKVSSKYPKFLPQLNWIALGAALIAMLVLIAGGWLRRDVRVRLSPAMALGCAAMFVVPSAWAISVLNPAYSGTAFDAAAGPGGLLGLGQGRPTGRAPGRSPVPGQSQVPGGGQVPGAGQPSRMVGGNVGTGALPGRPRPVGSSPAGVPGSGARGPAGPGRSGPAGPPGNPFDGGTETLTPAQQRLDDYLMAHRAGARFVAATTYWNSARPYIMATGQPVLPMGGYSGSVPQPTFAAVQQMVTTGELRYILVGGGSSFGGDPQDTELSRIEAWVTTQCTPVPAADYGGDDLLKLYRCG